MDEEKMAKWAEEKAIDTALFLLDYRETHEHPFRGTVEDLAEAMGITFSTFSVSILGMARSPEFVRKHGYVIPYVPKGPGPKDWSAIASQDPELLEEIKRGERIRKLDAVVAMRRVLAQSEYREPSFDGRTARGKREREALVQLEAALISLEQSADSK